MLRIYPVYVLVSVRAEEKLRRINCTSKDVQYRWISSNEIVPILILLFSVFLPVARGNKLIRGRCANRLLDFQRLGKIYGWVRVR